MQLSTYSRTIFCLLGLLAASTCLATVTKAASFSSEESIQAIKSIWPEKYSSQALRIAKRESGLIANTKGCAGTCIGLFQIAYPAHRHWLVSIGITSESMLLNPLNNSRAAYHLFKITGSNWSPWCHPSGYPRTCK